MVTHCTVHVDGKHFDNHRDFVLDEWCRSSRQNWWHDEVLALFAPPQILSLLLLALIAPFWKESIKRTFPGYPWEPLALLVIIYKYIFIYAAMHPLMILACMSTHAPMNSYMITCAFINLHVYAVQKHASVIWQWLVTPRTAVSISDHKAGFSSHRQCCP